jgi:hypothetical protein
MTHSDLATARQGAQDTYARRRARRAAETLATVDPELWDEHTIALVRKMGAYHPDRPELSWVDLALDVAFPPVRHPDECALDCREQHADVTAEPEHDMPSPYTNPPRFPEGTPEYDAYATELRAELDKFKNGEAPYDQGTEDIRVAMAGELRRMDLMDPEPEPCQPIGCDNGHHLPGCDYHA